MTQGLDRRLEGLDRRLGFVLDLGIGRIPGTQWISLKIFVTQTDREKTHGGTIPIRSAPSGGLLGSNMRPALAENVTSAFMKLQACSPSRRRTVLAWLLVLVWAGVIWQFGSDAYSLDRTSRFLQPLINWLLGDVELATRIQIHALIRKSAHFIEYAILALLSFRAALLTAERHQISTACWVALFLVATVAAADEFRQSFSTARTGSPHDVLIDVAGGLVGLLGVLVIMRRVRASRVFGRPI